MWSVEQLSLLRPFQQAVIPNRTQRDRVLAGSQLRFLVCVTGRNRLGGLRPAFAFSSTDRAGLLLRHGAAG